MSASGAAEPAASSGEVKMNAVTEYINHHVLNSDRWHVPGLFDLKFELPFLSLHSMMLLIAAFLLLYVFTRLYRKQDKVPSGLTNFLEIFIVFIRDDICISCLGKEDGRRMAPLFLNFFFFILVLNLLGLVPFLASATANLSVTAALASISLFFMTLGAMQKNGISGWVKAFIPHGVPPAILVMLVPIEMIGVLIKCGALTIRLFANMLAGHIVIGALIGLIVAFGAGAYPAAALAVGIYILKIGVSLLQAYIFTLLSAMFIGQIYHPSH